MSKLFTYLGLFTAGCACGWFFLIQSNSTFSSIIACEPSITSPGSSTAASTSPVPSPAQVRKNDIALSATVKAGELYAPVFRQAGQIHSTREGYILVRWEPIESAAGYAVQVRDNHGKTVREYLTHHNYAFLRDLETDESKRATLYTVQVMGVGAQGQRGPASPWKEIAMLRTEGRATASE